MLLQDFVYVTPRCTFFTERQFKQLLAPFLTILLAISHKTIDGIEQNKKKTLYPASKYSVNSNYGHTCIT